MPEPMTPRERAAQIAEWVADSVTATGDNKAFCADTFRRWVEKHIAAAEAAARADERAKGCPLCKAKQEWREQFSEEARAPAPTTEGK